MNRIKKTLALLALVGAGAVSATSAPTLDEAHLAYFQGQFSRSLQMYEQLAATGNAEAAEQHDASGAHQAQNSELEIGLSRLAVEELG